MNLQRPGLSKHDRFPNRRLQPIQETTDADHHAQRQEHGRKRDDRPTTVARDTIGQGTTLVAATVEAQKSAANVRTRGSLAVGGLVGLKAGGADDARGLRLEVKMDGGGVRTIEIVEGVRVYKGDRLRVHADHVEMLD